MTVPLWRQIQKKNFHSWEKLSLFLEWTESKQDSILPKASFPLNLPLRLAKKIAKNTLDDPILKQFVPFKEELTEKKGFVLDPVCDASFAKTSKLLHKYEGRVLLLTTGACAMNCRYCFRRNFPYEVERKQYTKELSLIEKDPSIQEVILSGGDPLSLGDEELKNLLFSLENIPHIKRIRLHSRFPIGIPERINETLLATLSNSQKQYVFVVHTNHPNELDPEVFIALKNLQKLGIPVLNQSVLLRGVNDSTLVLQDLFTKLSDHGIIPYYLHQLDPVSGASHFFVPEEEGKAIMQALSSRLSGYSLPKYVKEIPGSYSKTPILF
jgi:EF-P beta-lysylation protein EpmB